MSYANLFDIAGSAMDAQSVRLNTVASNLANAQSAASSVNQVYRAKHPVFAAVQQSAMQQQAGWGGISANDDDAGQGAGVKVLGIVESQSALERRYEPGHPLADKDGYVLYPNVNVVEEMADMISASRSFQVNVEMLQSAKTMAQKLLSLGQ
ncbi:MAG: flagellar basal body rod protein FlgC [Verrucomicrobiaceae bacterium]|nr:flagellar basal body rod protein FlgC [Verrucomicrobiaceae bacterium]